MKPYVELLMTVKRYGTYEELHISEDQLNAILTENVKPLLPDNLPRTDRIY